MDLARIKYLHRESHENAATGERERGCMAWGDCLHPSKRDGFTTVACLHPRRDASARLMDEREVS